MSEYRLKAMRVWVPAALFAEARGGSRPIRRAFFAYFFGKTKKWVAAPQAW